MQTIAFCERDEFCRAVLAKHWPDLPCFEDIHDLDADGLDRLGPIELVCGGFPCQPFSTAGKQEAQADDRHLWPQMRRVIALARPTWVIGENVTGIITLALDDVLADLEGMGYTARTFIIPACAVDAKHRRDRVWIIANANSNELWDESRRRGWKSGKGAAESGHHGAPRTMADADSSWQSQSEGSERPQRGWIGDRGEALANSECGGRSGQRSSRIASNTTADSPRETSVEPGDGGVERIWSPEPSVGRVAAGVPRRMDRLRALGNAVVPQVVYELGRAIMSTG